MATLHRSEDISVHSKFNDRLSYVKILFHQSPWMRNFEYSAGLPYDEFNQDTGCSENHISVQRRMANHIKEVDFGFLPVKSTLEDIYELYERNNLSVPHCRVPFYTVQSLQSCVYSFEVREDFTKPLYTRHPTTGIVTEHLFPYPHLPLFTMTAHPCISMFHAHRFLYWNTWLAKPRTEQPLVRVIVRSLLIWASSMPQADEWRTPSTASSSCPSLTHSSSSAFPEEPHEEDFRVTSWIRGVGVSTVDERVNLRSYANDEPVVRLEGVTMDDGAWREVAVRARPELGVKAVPQRALRSRISAVRPSKIPRRIRSGRTVKLR